jgi:DNA-directed RNA polymerase subunit alpha
VLPKIECEASSQNYGRFVISPLESGYGITLGNALRRVLLSSLPGAAVTSIRLSGVHHEFQEIPHVREDMTALILNVKQIRLKVETDEPVRLHAEITGEGEVTAGDLIAPLGAEVVNPELYLLTTDAAEAELDLEMTVQRGRGYSPAEERGKLPLGEIPVDAIFTPVRKANYTVERTRVGHQTDYDKLTIEIWTDSTISPKMALSESARLLVQHFSLVIGVDSVVAQMPLKDDEGIPGRIYETPIEDLELTVRAYNCLKRAGITKVGEILERLEQGEEEILAIRNFGRKSLIELVDRLEQKGYLDAIRYTRQPVGERVEDDDEDDDIGLEEPALAEK